jgi:hypothetical protein
MTVLDFSPTDSWSFLTYTGNYSNVWRLSEAEMRKMNSLELDFNAS